MSNEAEKSGKTAAETHHGEDASVGLLMITANVGSLFEDPARLMQPWLKEFLNKIAAVRPQFLALHLQEVGGKTYEKSMEYVHEFIRSLCEASEMQDYSAMQIYMDEDYHSAEHFTALGNLYFAHKSLECVKIWNFLTHEWETPEGRNIYTGNIETIATKEKSKFPQHFFPECKWSRKGFMRTRWDINNTVVDFVNIHLFHDASNLAACEEFPSVYCKTRRRALVHTLERFHLDERNGFVPYFVFGDFNFRCDTEGVIKELTENLTAHRVQNIKNDSTKVHYRNSLGDNVLTIGKKEFNHADHQLKFKEVWLKKFDRELEELCDILLEYPIEFPPTYPYEEDPEMPTDYMSTRCPSWCDRILMSPQTKEIICDTQINKPYSIIGENVCMGDHKPIYLNIRLKPNRGTYRCCICYIYNANNNTSTSPAIPAVAIAKNNNVYCPYKSKIYKRILLECKRINRVSKRWNTERNDNRPAERLTSGEDSEEMLHYPPVSINLIDSDNICVGVCMCTQISSKVEEDVDGTICPECCNIIKKQGFEHRYRLISKRLLLSDNIIVNRIDAQYLNTNISQQYQEPYTPESAESNSPCPELNSLSTSSNSPYERTVTAPQVMHFDVALEKFDNGEGKANNSHATQDSFDNQRRGIVSPGQLKSRLEDLQRSSMQNTNRRNGGAAGKSDVENVGIDCAAGTGDEQQINSRLPKCCNIH